MPQSVIDESEGINFSLALCYITGIPTLSIIKSEFLFASLFLPSSPPLAIETV